MANDNMQYGVLHEIGDIGLGFDPVSEEENKQINESVQKEQEKKEER